MSRHERCNLYVDNFSFEHFGINCPACNALGEAHLCGSHPHRPVLTAPVPAGRLLTFSYFIVLSPIEFSLIFLVLFQHDIINRHCSRYIEIDGGHRTATYLRSAHINGEKLHFWVSCNHGKTNAGVTTGATGTILFEKEVRDAVVVYHDPSLDLILLSTKFKPRHIRTIDYDQIVFSSKLVYVCGFGSDTGTDSSKSSVLTCHIAHEEAGKRDEPALHHPRWRSPSFFLVDTTADFGFSGGPVLNDKGELVGMLCESAYEATSWCLRSTFIMSAIAIYLESQLAPPPQSSSKSSLTRMSASGRGSAYRRQPPKRQRLTRSVTARDQDDDEFNSCASDSSNERFLECRIVE
mmetsp:Transcript_28152/g.40079  ORF Transcript_28152/g.40079 Transcript_28152/m.40079 type:complete len:350 (-) Transcript_28152:147-1196(-)